MTPDPRDLMRRLDARERAVLVAICEHKVLLTEHLKAMFFGSIRRAQDRLRHLARRGLIDTWYPPQPRGMGKASGHHTLTKSGARVVALLLGVARSELRYVVREEEDREQDSYLGHRIGVNEFFCALIEAGRQNDGHGLAKWVPERTVRTAVKRDNVTKAAEGHEDYRKHTYVLRSFLKCVLCGLRMHGKVRRGRNSAYYMCEIYRRQSGLVREDHPRMVYLREDKAGEKVVEFLSTHLFGRTGSRR